MTPHRHVRHTASTPLNVDGIASEPHSLRRVAPDHKKGLFMKLSAIALASIAAVAPARRLRFE
jgi:hypothetical protein